MTDQAPVVPGVDGAASGQAAASLVNADGTANVYITSDPSLNVVTLTLTNGLADAIVFPPGTPVAYESLPAGQSAIYLYLNGLIGNAGIQGTQFAAPGWEAGSFAGPDGLRYLVIAPSSQVTLRPGGSLSFRLTRLLVSGSPRSGTADILLAGADGVTTPQRDVPLYVNIASPPQPGKQALDLRIGFATPVVYAAHSQSLLLHLVNGGQTALVPDGTPSWHGVTPTFQLTFVYGDGNGALTTVTAAAGIAVDISDEYGNVWQPPQRRDQGPRPYWIMRPDPNGGGTVLGQGEQASIEFAVTGIEPSPLPAGLDSAITVAYVSWHDIPGYNDGSTPVIITKKAGPRVTRFTADPPMVPFGEPAVQTTLTWDTAHATGVRFDAPQVGPAQVFSASGSGPLAGGISAPPGTTISLIAYKDTSTGGLPGSAGPPHAGDQEITATARLHIGGAQRADVRAGIGSLGGIVLPPGAATAFFFQQNAGQEWQAQLTKAAILDIRTRTVSGTVDVGPLIPSKGGGTMIAGAVPSPDGKTIHVLASSGQGASHLKPEYYMLALDVASARYGQPVPLGTQVPSGLAAAPALLATPDGGTVYVSVLDVSANGVLHVDALDAASYRVTGQWTWQPRADQPWLDGAGPVGCSPDGSVLLMASLGGLAVIDVAGGFTVTGVLNIAAGLGLILPGQPVLSPDGRRAYLFALDNLQEPVHGSVLAVDVDLAAGTLTLARTTRLGLVPILAGPAALSPDAATLYVLTAADTLTAFDTATFAAVPYSCGEHGQFTPVLIAAGTGAGPGVLYGTGANGLTNGTVSVITIL